MIFLTFNIIWMLYVKIAIKNIPELSQNWLSSCLSDYHPYIGGYLHGTFLFFKSCHSITKSFPKQWVFGTTRPLVSCFWHCLGSCAGVIPFNCFDSFASIVSMLSMFQYSCNLSFCLAQNSVRPRCDQHFADSVLRRARRVGTVIGDMSPNIARS